MAAPTALFRVALALLLPRWLREASGAEMVSTFRTGQDEAAGRGPVALVVFWLREARGLIHIAYRARRPDPWTRRTHRGPGPALPSSPPRTMDALVSDLRYAVRTFLRRPGMSILTVLTLSLGIGASTAMFSVVQSVLLRPLPYPEPDELVTVYTGRPDLRGHPTLDWLADRGPWSWPEYFGVAESQTVFSEMAAYEGWNATLTGDGPAQQVSGVRFTWPLLPMLGVTPHAGRLFNADDAQESRVVMLSHGEWRDRYGADPGVVGRQVTLNDERWEIVGVLPAGFEVSPFRDADYWVPRTGSFTDPGIGNHGGTRALARLGPGVTLAQARAEITRILEEILPADHGEHVGSVIPRQEDETHQTRPVLLVMLASSLLLLVVACGNAAAFLLGVGIDRERELAVRGAIGADRRRMVSQMLTESGLLALAAIAGGMVAAVGLSRVMLAVAPQGIPGLDRSSIDLTVLGFSTVTAVVFGLGFGLIPALSLSQVDLAAAMGTGRTTRTRRARLQSAVVVGELALAGTLAVSALLLTRTVSALGDEDTGMRVDRLAAVAIATPFARFRTEDGETDQEAVQAYLAEIREGIAALPGVEAVATTSVPPLTGWRGNNGVMPENWDPEVPLPIAERRFVSPNFFDALGIEIVEGRGFSPDEVLDQEPYVVVISQGLADLGWPDGSPLGRPIHYWGREATVVGVAENVRDQSVAESTELAFYAPGVAEPMLVRTAGDPSALVGPIRERIWSIDEDVPLLVASSLTDLIADQTAQRRYRARLMAIFAALAGILALLGIYGVTSRAVTRRTREIGIRVALGAERGRVWGLVSSQALRLGLWGAAVGVGLSLLVAPFIEGFLYGVSPSDPASLAAVGLGLPLLGVVAALVPALRATRVEPLEALREE